ncbi:NAD(P)H-dependent oxidoreductase [Canibacter sp. lx-45]|uniref:NADPH-dependent FMN reductase n=1 Tax=Canibacter zhuwentaonis TaxID=2837491 RepID=UPI001BDD5824|nr:NAD(P)H-dependent oxidoreductase [Canibacter zhuwentaonis]MBT1035289.1 NAD(P)H-dependent oxidoreductase [Canibacter zhuwentaonis]
MRTGIIIGSTREGRINAEIAAWIYKTAQSKPRNATYELIDLKDYEIPFFTGAVSPRQLNKKYDNTAVQAWSEKIDSCDAYILVTPEYNGSVPAPLKNAFDSISDEWIGKPIAFAGYSYSSGISVIKAWRAIVPAFQMQDVADALEISLVTEVKDGVFTPTSDQLEKLESILAKLEKAAA